jgi:hypothetical protein
MNTPGMLLLGNFSWGIALDDFFTIFKWQSIGVNLLFWDKIK